MKYGKGFFQKKRVKGVSVLSITNAFPSLIQPWFVNQLVQIIEHQGESRILAMDDSAAQYSQLIDHYKLLDYTTILPWLQWKSAARLLLSLFNPRHWPRLVKGLIALNALPNELAALLPKYLQRLQFALLGDLNNVDIIHCHSELAAWRFLPLIVASGKPFVLTFHGLPPKGVAVLSSFQRALLAKYASSVLVNTAFAKRHYGALGGDLNKVTIVPQGLNIKAFPFKPATLNAPHQEVKLLTVGRFHPDKGQDYSLRAVASLIHQGAKLHYTLVGNGPRHQALVNLSHDLGIAQHVSVRSQLSDEALREVYRQSHIFILPSLRDKEGFHEETQGVVLQEAQASGLLVIATRTGGIAECIDDTRSGFLIADRSEQEISDKIDYLLNNKAQWPAWQKAGRAWVETHFSAELIAKKNQAVYHALLKRSAQSKENGAFASLKS